MPIRSGSRSRAQRLALAVIAAVVLLTGALNVRSVFGDDDEGWTVDPTVPSALAQLVGAPIRSPSRLDAQIASLQETLRNDPDAPGAATQLGNAYLQMARETGDPSYYPKADELFARALDRNADDFVAMNGQGALALARHEFADALEWGERARELNPHYPATYGVIGDAQIELGRYPEAIATFQQMVDLRPDLPSYARVSYARELMGDTAGALAAMESAAQAGAARPESVAWTHAQLGNLRFNGGDLAGAEWQYRQAVATMPGYVYGLAGLGRVAAARGEIEAAIVSYTQAIQTMPLPEFVIALGDVYESVGRQAEAAEQYALVEAIQRLFAANGVDTDLEMALFDADHARNLPAAVERARAAYTARPSIKAADVLAWTLYQSGDDSAAREASRQALRLGTKDALMLFHAGMIEARLGDTAAAIGHLRAALDLNPAFSPVYAPQARAALNALQSGNAPVVGAGASLGAEDAP